MPPAALRHRSVERGTRHGYDIHRNRPSLKQAFRCAQQGSPSRAYVIKQEYAQAFHLRRCRKGLCKLLALCPVQTGLGSGRNHAPEHIRPHGNAECPADRPGYLQPLVESTFPQAGRMERERYQHLRRQGRRIMLFAQVRRYAAKGIKSIKPAPELPPEYEFPQWPFINAMEKEAVPRRELLQTFPAGHDGSVGKSGRLTAMRAISGFAPLERGAATGTEQR